MPRIFGARERRLQPHERPPVWAFYATPQPQGEGFPVRFVPLGRARALDQLMGWLFGFAERIPRAALRRRV